MGDNAEVAAGSGQVVDAWTRPRRGVRVRQARPELVARVGRAARAPQYR